MTLARVSVRVIVQVRMNHGRHHVNIFPETSKHGTETTNSHRIDKA